MEPGPWPECLGSETPTGAGFWLRGTPGLCSRERGTLSAPLLCPPTRCARQALSQKERQAFPFFLLSKAAIPPPCPALWFSLSEFTVSEVIVFEVSREIVCLKEFQDAQAF